MQEVLSSTNLGRPEHYLDDDRLGDDHRYGAVNLMKGGIVYSDFVVTVSPNHADEATYGDGAFGLGHTLHVHRHKFRGILNGVDYDVWNPEVDSLIPARYSARASKRIRGSKEATPGPVLVPHDREPDRRLRRAPGRTEGHGPRPPRAVLRTREEPSSCYSGEPCTRMRSAVTSATSSTI